MQIAIDNKRHSKKLHDEVLNAQELLIKQLENGKVDYMPTDRFMTFSEVEGWTTQFLRRGEDEQIYLLESDVGADEYTPHSHDNNSEEVFVLKGSLTITFHSADGEPVRTVQRSSGDPSFHIQPGATHTYTNCGDTPLLIISKFIPPLLSDGEYIF